MRSPLDKFVLMALLAAAAGSVAAQPYVFPSKGQSAEQQKKDEQYCYNWAVQQTGYNPAYRQPAPSGTPSPEPGSGAKGALVGGALGAIVGDSSKSAATGAVTSRGFLRLTGAFLSAASATGCTAGTSNPKPRASSRRRTPARSRASTVRAPPA
mgnify:CR=1 FL=1